MMIEFSPEGYHLNDSVPRGASDHRYVGHIDTAADELVEQPFAIGSNTAGVMNYSARAAESGGLVCPFAAGKDGVASAGDRLAGVGETVDAVDVVNVQ